MEGPNAIHQMASLTRASQRPLLGLYGFKRLVTGSGSEHHREIKAGADSHRWQWAVEVRSHYNGN